MTIEALIADDHAIIRDGLRKLLADTPDLRVSGEAADGNALLDLIRQRHWDILLLDLSMPGRNGLELIRLVHTEQPKLPILIFSMHPEEQYAVRAIRAGASGYLTKGSSTDQILPVIRKVAGGAMFISPKVAELLATDFIRGPDDVPHTRLTDREFEIFSRIVHGCSPAEIAAELSLSAKTVSSHKSHILEKMGLSTQIDLLRYAIVHGLLDTAYEQGS